MPTLSNELDELEKECNINEYGNIDENGHYIFKRFREILATQNTALLKEVTDYFYWRIDCNTLISELEGWRGCIDNAKDQTERHFNSKLAAMGGQ